MAFGELRKKPNILILMTDEQRHVMHWPAGWEQKNLPSMRRLMENGVTFEYAFANACTCSPSRTTLFTSTYPAHHGVTEVLGWLSSQPARDMQGQLKSGYQNLGKMLRTAGYEVTYKGKWHMNRPLKYDPLAGFLRWTDEDRYHMSKWGFEGWNPPDAGEGIPLWEFGGGRINNDGRFVDGYGHPHRPDVNPQRSALAYLDGKSPDDEQPFFLTVSLVNPHDILAYPGTGLPYLGQLPAYMQGGYSLSDFRDLEGGFELPPNFKDDLSTKPWVQQQSLKIFDQNLGILQTEEEQLNYVKFYAYLHTVVDKQIQKVLDKLDERGLTNDTLIVRVSDHGEMGMSHSGMRQKTYNAYEETMRVPMIFSNPVLFGGSRAVRTQSMASLIDVMPTLATIAEVPHKDERWTFQGFDLTPVLEDPKKKVQEEILFTFDDVDSTLPLKGSTHIRCLRTPEWKYAVYYDPITGYAPEYELYAHDPGPGFPGLDADPLELVNLAHQEVAAKLPPDLREKVAKKRQELHERLTEKARNRHPDEPHTLANRHTGTLPDEIVWPKISGVSPNATQYVGGLK